jgi:hypothetical protein
VESLKATQHFSLSPKRLPQHFLHSPRLDRVNRATALRTTQPRGQLHDGEAHRDAWKPTNRPQSNDAASRAVALDVRITVSGKLLDGGVQGFISFRTLRRRPVAGMQGWRGLAHPEDTPHFDCL